MVNKCISVSADFDKLAQEFKCSWSEAAKMGMALELGARGVEQYCNSLNLGRMMEIIKNYRKILVEEINAGNIEP